MSAEDHKTTRPDPVWEAIEREMEARGDEDIRAGLAWLTDADKAAIADAARKAVMAGIKVTVSGGGGGPV